MDGSFTINTAFNGILSITESAQYTTLRDAVITGVSIHHDTCASADSEAAPFLFVVSYIDLCSFLRILCFKQLVLLFSWKQFVPTMD